MRTKMPSDSRQDALGTTATLDRVYEVVGVVTAL
jgi:hypothetical protein